MEGIPRRRLLVRRAPLITLTKLDRIHQRRGPILLRARFPGRHPTLLKHTHYSLEEVLPVAAAILSEKDALPSHLRALEKKFSTPKYGRVSSIVLDFF